MKTRFKTGAEPGDISKREKAAMLEGKHPDKRRSKAFKKFHLLNEKAVIRERTKKEIEQQLL